MTEEMKKMITGVLYSEISDEIGPNPVMWFPTSLSEHIRMLISIKVSTILTGEEEFKFKDMFIMPFPSLGSKALIKFIEWKDENRPHINLNFKTKYCDIDLSSRYRLEYRDVEDGQDKWRHRNKFTARFPWKLTPLNLQPYIADEIFIEADHSHIDQNRLYSGFTCKLAENISGNLFYLWQKTRGSSSWIDANIHMKAKEFN